MPRRKARAEEGAIESDHHTTPEGPVSTAEAPPTNEVEKAFREHGMLNGDQLAEQNGNGQHHESDEPKQQFRPVRETFTSTAAGVRAVEDKRFVLPRVGIDFTDDARATDEEKTEMKERGIRYERKDKGYTAIANSETRGARDELARKFADRRLKAQGEGQER